MAAEAAGTEEEAFQEVAAANAENERLAAETAAKAE